MTLIARVMIAKNREENKRGFKNRQQYFYRHTMFGGYACFLRYINCFYTISQQQQERTSSTGYVVDLSLHIK